MNQFKPGDRVKLSFAGRKQFTKHDRLATIKRLHKEDSDLVWLQWDGTKAVQSYHFHFLEIDQPGI